MIDINLIDVVIMKTIRFTKTQTVLVKKEIRYVKFKFVRSESRLILELLKKTIKPLHIWPISSMNVYQMYKFLLFVTYLLCYCTFGIR